MEELRLREMVVAARRALTPHITEFTLRPTAGGALPRFEPGSHVTIQTPSGANRRYSLVNGGEAPTEYVVAIKREPDSRGGSASMVDLATAGTVLNVSDPDNSFPLRPAPKYRLIAGGVGVTPILPMARRLAAEGKPFEVIYCTRSPEETAYLEEMRALGLMVTIHHDGGDLDNAYDFWDHFATPDATHSYCCGPRPLLEEIKAVSGHWPEGRIHFEDFRPVEAVRADDVPFTVTLAGTGRQVEVPADRSILEALRAAGERTSSSCESGACGTCRCRLVSGEVDHRDMVLMDDEKDRFIMICVSRARRGDLVIEL